MDSQEDKSNIEIGRGPKKGGFLRIAIVLVIVIAVGFGAKGYLAKQGAAKQAAQQQAPAAPTVVLYSVEETDLATQREYVGKVEAIQNVDLKAQVAGEIKQVNFKEGSFVRAGQLLFTIDSSQYQATVDLRKAEIEQAEANLVKAEKYLARVKAADKRSISAADIDTAESAFLQAKAAVAQGKAALRLAEIDLGHTRITSPITGKIGAAAFTKGNYVSQASGALATIVQMDPIRVSFALPDRDYLNQLEAFKKNGSVYNTTLILTNGKELAASGARDFESNEVDQKSGTIQTALRFANAEGLLIPGSMVRIATKPVKSEISLVVPQGAVLADSKGDYVYTVDDKNIAHQTRIVLGDEAGAMRKVTSGLKAGDKVIQIGIQNVRPEAPVSPAKTDTGPRTAAERTAEAEGDIQASGDVSQDKEGN